MHDPSFMALALIVSEKMTFLEVGLTLALQDVCMTPVSWL